MRYQVYQQINLTNGAYFSVVVFPALFCTSWAAPFQLVQNSRSEEQGGCGKAEISLG